MPCTRREIVAVKRAGFSPVGLVVLLAAMMAAVAILLPMLLAAGEESRARTSRNNLSELGVAMKYYEGLGRGNLKPDKWEESLAPYIDGDARSAMTCPLRDKEKRNGGVYSYALSTFVPWFGAGDDSKVAIITSDHRTIDIETRKCTGGNFVVTGSPVARYRDQAFALHYGGSVKTYKLDDIMPSDLERIFVYWLPHREHGNICGTVVEIKPGAKKSKKGE